jgi:hypothetical protein
MAGPSLRDNFAATVELYATFIKQIKAENPQFNISEVSFAHRNAGKNSFDKRHSTRISNVSNTAVDDRFIEKHEYNALTPDHKNMIMLKRLKSGHVGKVHTGNGTSNGKNNGKGATIKSLTHSIVALSTKIDKFSFPEDDEEEDESQMKKKGHPTALMRLLPAKARRRNAAPTKRQTFQLSQCAWDMLAVWKKQTYQTSTHMQIVVFVERRF